VLANQSVLVVERATLQMSEFSTRASARKVSYST